MDKFEVRAVLAYDGPLFEFELFVEFCCCCCCVDDDEDKLVFSLVVKFVLFKVIASDVVVVVVFVVFVGVGERLLLLLLFEIDDDDEEAVFAFVVCIVLIKLVSSLAVLLTATSIIQSEPYFYCDEMTKQTNPSISPNCLIVSETLLWCVCLSLIRSRENKEYGQTFVTSSFFFLFKLISIKVKYNLEIEKTKNFCCF